MLNEFRLALRQLWATPAFTLVAAGTLALGIGANTAIFSVFDALVLRQLPIERPEELVWFGDSRVAGVTTGFPDGPASAFSLAFFRRLSQPNPALKGVAAMGSMPVDAYGRWSGGYTDLGTDLERMQARLVSGNFFPLLGTGAAAGRLLDPHDDLPGATPVAVISDRYWERRFRRAPNVLGRTVQLNEGVYTLVGVTPRDFAGVVVGENPDLYVPLVHLPRAQQWIRDTEQNLTQFLHLLARRQAPMAAASTAINTAYTQWLREVAGDRPSTERSRDLRQARIELTDASRGVSELRYEFSQPLQILFAVVAIVLLIGCANLANLLLARTASRRREMAVRLALGAGRWQLVRQMLVEGVTLALVGGAAGLLIAAWATPGLLTLVELGPNPIALDATVNARVLGFTFLVSLLTAILFSMVPAWAATRVDAGPALKEGKGTAGRRSGGLAPLLVAGQVCLALLLVTGAGLFLRTLQQVQAIRPGFDTNVLVLELNGESASLKGEAKAAWAGRLLQRVEAVPGVRAASFSMLHFGGGRWGLPLWPAGAERVKEKRVGADGNSVGLRYFEAMGIPLLRGRTFRPTDTGPQRVAVVNETLAARLFPGSEAIGRRFQFPDGTTYEIVGIVKNTKIGALRERARGMYWVHNAQSRDGFEDLVIRAEGDPRTLWGALRQAVRQENANVAIARMALTGDYVQGTLGQERLLARLSGLFGVLALGLAAVGLYGLLAYTTSQRTGEFGIRMALGATAGQVLRLVMGQSLGVLAVGLLAGVPAVLAAGRLVAGQLYGVTPYDPLTLSGAAALLVAAGLSAAFRPAWRASRISPMQALRDE
ncbi:MAG: ABC transporter permease [Bryobacteraceae bacterium]|nr:ABC transporter permease [Bryobacteraceae bacterium]